MNPDMHALALHFRYDNLAYSLVPCTTMVDSDGRFLVCDTPSDSMHTTCYIVGPCMWTFIVSLEASPDFLLAGSSYL
jgi:hypothetical protein